MTAADEVLQFEPAGAGVEVDAGKAGVLHGLVAPVLREGCGKGSGRTGGPYYGDLHGT